jgi:hypothetical protein
VTIKVDEFHGLVMDFGATYEQPEVILAINGNRYRCLGELNTGKKNMVRAAGLEPAQLYFSAGSRLRALHERQERPAQTQIGVVVARPRRPARHPPGPADESAPRGGVVRKGGSTKRTSLI